MKKTALATVAMHKLALATVAMQKTVLATVAIQKYFTFDILSFYTKFQPHMTVLRKSVWVTLVGPTWQKFFNFSSYFMFISHGDHTYQKSWFYDHFEIFCIWPIPVGVWPHRLPVNRFCSSLNLIPNLVHTTCVPNLKSIGQTWRELSCFRQTDRLNGYISPGSG